MLWGFLSKPFFFVSSKLCRSSWLLDSWLYFLLSVILRFCQYGCCSATQLWLLYTAFIIIPVPFASR